MDYQQSIFGQSTGQTFHARERKNQNQLSETGASPCVRIALNSTDIRRLLAVALLIPCSTPGYSRLDFQPCWEMSPRSNPRGRGRNRAQLPVDFQCQLGSISAALSSSLLPVVIGLLFWTVSICRRFTARA